MEFDESVPIRRPPSEVFAMLSDVQRWALHSGSPILAMDKLPPGPTEVGTRWREVVRLGPWMRMTIWSEVTAMESGEMLAEHFWGGNMVGELVYTVRPQNGHTVLRQRESMVAVGWLRPFGWVVGQLLKPRLHRRLLEIRDELEGGLVPTRNPGS